MRRRRNARASRRACGSGIARTRTVEGNVALFSHGHLLRVLAARWLALPLLGQHLLLDPGTLSVLGYYRAIPALKA
jgi:probable phosphoglycerate mutase